MDYSYENNFKETKMDLDIELITKEKKKTKPILKLRSLWNEKIWSDAIIQMSWIILNTSITRTTLLGKNKKKRKNENKKNWKLEENYDYINKKKEGKKKRKR